MSTLLWLSLLRYQRHHPWQLGLSILGITLGVAVVLAVDLANASASRSLQLATTQVSGGASHRLSNAQEHIPQIFYLQLKQKIAAAAPIVSGFVLSSKDQRRLQILGIDPFAEAPFRSYLSPSESVLQTSNLSKPLSDLLTRASTVLATDDIATETVDGSLTVMAGERAVTLEVLGQLSDARLSNLIIMDISTAQTLLKKGDYLSHIDLMLPDEASAAALQTWVREHLAADVTLESVRNATALFMSSAPHFKSI